MADKLNHSKLPESWQIEAGDEQKEYWKDPENENIYEIQQDIYPENPRDTYDSLSTSIIYHDGDVCGKGPQSEYTNVPYNTRHLSRADAVGAVVDNALSGIMPDEDIDKALHNYAEIKHIDANKDEFDEAFNAIKDNENMPDVFKSINTYTPLQDMAEAGAFHMDDYVRVLGPEESGVDQYTDLGAFITRDDVKREYGEITPESWSTAENVIKGEHQMDMDYEEGRAYILSTFTPDGKQIDDVGGYFGQDVFCEIPEGSEKLGIFDDINECIQATKDVIDFNAHDIEKVQVKLPFDAEIQGYAGSITAANKKDGKVQETKFFYENTPDNDNVRIYPDENGKLPRMFRNNHAEYTAAVKDACSEFEKQQTHEKPSLEDVLKEAEGKTADLQTKDVKNRDDMSR